jgi:hypothetical protein
MANWVLLGIVVAVFAVLIALRVRRQSRHGGSRWGVHGARANFESPPQRAMVQGQAWRSLICQS